MTRRLPLLDRIDIPSPCPADWNAMTGDSLIRFCESCSRDVHDLSALTRRQAEGLIRRSGGRLCVRITRDAEGRTRSVAAPIRSAVHRGRPSPEMPPLPVWAAHPQSVQRASRAAATALTVALLATMPSVAQAQSPATAYSSERAVSPSGSGFAGGLVTDPNGAVVVGATVTLGGPNGFATIVSDGDGRFQFDNLPAGTYELSVVANGFSPFEARSFVITAGETENLAAELSVDSEEFVSGGAMVMSVSSKAHCYVWKVRAEEEGVDDAEDAPEAQTPPLLAALELGEEELREALEAGANANERFEFGRTPLMHAADDEDLVRLLLEKGADPTMRDEAGATALHYASLADEGGSVFALCRAGADANATDHEGVTPLILAAWDGNEETVAALLAAGADVRTRDRRGRSALDLAREAENDEMIEILEVAGAK